MLIPLPEFTLLHVLLSVVGILAGVVVIGGLIAGTRLNSWIAVFLATTFLTNATGFFFPFARILPSHIVGGISLVILPIAMAALYWKHLAGGWRRVFVVTSVIAVYFNVFVLIVQLFQKFPLLIAVAPTQQSPA
ncbi:MAG: hypothetical protein ABI742_12015, partial [Gemmatimonadota bacterium]